jgi:hypothetical protein
MLDSATEKIVSADAKLWQVIGRLPKDSED